MMGKSAFFFGTEEEMEKMKKRIQTMYRTTVYTRTVHELLCAGTDLLCAWLVSVLLSRALAGEWTQAIVSVGAAAAAMVLSGLVRRKTTMLCDKAEQEAMLDYRVAVCQAVIRQEIAAETQGELDARLQGDAESVAAFYASALPNAIASGVSLALCLALLAAADGWLALIFGTLSMLQLLPTLVYEKWAKPIYMQTMANEEAYCNWIHEGLSGMSTLKAYEREDWFMARFRAHSQSIVRACERETRTSTVEDVISGLISTVLSYGAYLILGAFVLLRGVPLAQTPLLLVLAQHAFSAVEAMVNSRMQHFRYQQAMERLLGDEGEAQRELPLLPEGGETLVAADRLRKVYGDKVVVASASMEIRQGERLLLQGVNGAGKTTLLRMLLGSCTPTDGEVRRRKATVAFAFQEEPALGIPCGQLVQALEQAGMLRAEDFARHHHAFQNDDIMDRTPEECSAGQRKRFYLSIALAVNAELLILDEPTNHLDADSVRYLLSQLQGRRSALLLCTHDSRINLAWDRVYRMEEGCLHAA